MQDYFGYIIKKHETLTENSLIKLYVNKRENSIIFKIYLEILTYETMNLLGSTKNKVTKNENGKNMLHLEIAQVVLVHCNLVNIDYQQNLRDLNTFVSNKSFGQLLDISPKDLIFLKTYNSQFSYIEVWFTDQNFKLLEIEDRIKIN